MIWVLWFGHDFVCRRSSRRRSLLMILPDENVGLSGVNRKLSVHVDFRAVRRGSCTTSGVLVALFFPDRTSGYREARRALKPGGHFLFNVWDRIEENVFADDMTNALAEIFPSDPPRFTRLTLSRNRRPCSNVSVASQTYG
jgi:hypothetical protein